MTTEEVLNLLIKNMQTQQENMNLLKGRVNERIVAAVKDITPIGKLSKNEIISKVLENERYAIAAKSAYIEVEQWATNTLKAIKNEKIQ